MENVELSQETTRRPGISRTISVTSSRNEHEKSLNLQGETPSVGLQSTTIPARETSGGKNVWFAAATSGQNLNNLNTINVQGSTRRSPPDNPYARHAVSQDQEQGISHIQQWPLTPARVDKAITLKKSN
jgi:hypothetical protein